MPQFDLVPGAATELVPSGGAGAKEIAVPMGEAVVLIGANRKPVKVGGAEPRVVFAPAGVPVSIVSSGGKTLVSVGDAGVGGNALPQFPTGSVLAMAAADAARYNLIRNSAETASLPASFFGNPKAARNPRMSLRLTNDLTAAAADATGPDGVVGAYRVNWNAGASLPALFPFGNGGSSFPGGEVLAPGTYTFAFQARSLDGANHTLRLTGDGLPGGGGQNYAVTPAWQTFTHTHTVATATAFYPFFQMDAAGGSLALDDFRHGTGTAAPVSPPADRHINKLGAFPMAGGVIRTTGATPHAYVPRALDASEADVAEVTLAAAIKLDPAMGYDGYYSVLAKRDDFAAIGNGDGLDLRQAGGRLTLQGKTGSLIEAPTLGLDKAGWVTLIATGGPSGSALWIDGVRYTSSTVAFVPGKVDFYSLLGLRTGQPFRGDVVHVRAYERVLTDAEVRALHAALAAEITGAGATYAPSARAVSGEGDSITAGTGTDLPAAGYLSRAARLFNVRPQIANYAVPGSTIADVEARKPRMAAFIASAKAVGRTPVVSLMIGINSLADITAGFEPWAQRVEDYWTWARTQGALVIGATTGSIQGISASQKTALDAYNASLRTRFAAGKCDALVDYYASSLGTWSSTDYSDNVHWGNAGADKAAAEWKAKAAPLLPDRA